MNFNPSLAHTGWCKITLLGAGLLTAAALAFAANGGLILDDAYIHLRYAWQLLHQHRLEFNPGQRSAGSSAVGYTLVLAALGSPLPRDAWPSMVQALSVACWMVSWATWGALIARLMPAPSASEMASNWRWGSITLAIALMFLPPATARWFHDGMETSMVMACAFGTAVAIDRLALAGEKHSLWPYVGLGGLIAAPFLIRIDGLLISGGAAALTLYRLTGAKRWVALGVATVFIVANIGALFWIYGGQFPDSMTAKGGAGASGLGWLLGFCRAMVTASPLWFVFLAFPFLARGGRRLFVEVIMVFGPLAAICAAGLLRKQAIHGARYFLPTIAWSVASAAHLLAHQGFVIRLDVRRYRQTLVGLGLIAGIHTLVLLPRTLTAKGSYNLPHEVRGEQVRLMLFDVGIIGWDSNAIIQDLSGLINGKEVADADLVDRPCLLTKQLGAPDYLILRPDQAAKLDLRGDTVYFTCNGASPTHAYRRSEHVVMSADQYQRSQTLTMYLWIPVPVGVGV